MTYWLVFALVFISLCAREGKRVASSGSDKPVSRLLRRLYEFGSRNRETPEKDG